MIGLRWQAGTQELPPHCLGHIGYSIVPWKQRLGYATSALAQLLPEARAEGLLYVELTTSQRTQVRGASSRRTAVFWLSTSLSPFNTALHRVCATVLPSYEREI